MTTLEKLKKYLEGIKKNDKQGKKINAFLELRPEKVLIDEAKKIDEKIKKGVAGKLAGKIISVKAVINVLGFHASCGSKTLEDYKSPYDATAIRKVKDEDGLIIGMVNCDEFACGWSGETSAFGPTKNPHDLSLVAGGSSSGSVASVAANFCDLSLGTDTGGSIRVPSSHCGVVGVKPTYSSVSRYGLIDMCMSFDQIGPIAKNVRDAALLLSVIYGKDKHDSISQGNKKINLKNIEKIPKNLTIGLIDFPASDERIDELINKKINLASEKYGWKIKKVKIPYIDLALATYYPIVYTEFFSGTRKFDGRRFGKRIEDTCGPEVLRRILGGREISKAEHKGRYYNQALKVRRLLQKEFEKVFQEFDALVSFAVPRLPHKIGEKIGDEEMFFYDALTCPMNIVGNCAISLPIGKINNLPVGMQIACDKFCDERMLQIANAIERLNE
ncbi:MAG: amidase family protein [Candidatus Pacearchaeota archaeon]|jgi:aspartyl-tRNA(Asn)/glutamyl-tRNA(Gln) amidotransferase subunit A